MAFDVDKPLLSVNDSGRESFIEPLRQPCEALGRSGYSAELHGNNFVALAQHGELDGGELRTFGDACHPDGLSAPCEKESPRLVAASDDA